MPGKEDIYVEGSFCKNEKCYVFDISFR